MSSLIILTGYPALMKDCLMALTSSQLVTIVLRGVMGLK